MSILVVEVLEVLEGQRDLEVRLSRKLGPPQNDLRVMVGVVRCRQEGDLKLPFLIRT